ncbi:recombinase family protein [Mesorhizobium sp. BAC0120]|uniref:recombinase family protein n=1 Tax=Mesorhizobium sp. BAC0120 TaxID=3090670 RepID=UPI00298D4AA5|nr:recombinase family protein [Mesorhizobium sp. BAC0120]MDW6022212.1 recombinase family protein [Mesorhizobium sp. BAC0120]
MPRVALYARYSSDNQREASIEDQLRLCREHAAREGWTVLESYSDAAISGSSIIRRPGIRRLLADAQRGQFEIVLAEALDRLSRDQEDVAGLFKRLRFAGVKIATLSEGAVDELHVGLKGTMNALFLRDLAAKIRRGQSGRILKGYAAGGLSYGYRVVKKLDESGEPIRGLREIDEDQAEVVRRIFREFASGQSARAIAAGLNRDGVPSPFGAAWAASTINGNLKRRSGFLYNEAYIGLLIFNRLQMVKDPETGKRLSRPNPPEQWQVVAAPHLRIIDDELWDVVQARKKLYGGSRLDQRRRPKHMFSGLVRCGCCGASYTVKNRDQLACAAHREKGTCDNSRTIRVAELEKRVLEGIERRLLAPDAIAGFLAEYDAEQKRLSTSSRQRRREIERRLDGLDRQISNIVDAIADGIATASMKARLMDLEGEKESLADELKVVAQTDSVVELHPAAIEAYRRKVSELQSALCSDEDERREAAALIRSLVTRVTILPKERRGQVELRVHGALAELLNLPNRQRGEPPNAVLMVAEEGFEPPTQGL